VRIAVIPARGGSKRIPRKNIRHFRGKPIIAYSIECAIASSLFDRVVVSTDDAEIGAVARQYGAETPFLRPADLSDDYTGTTEVVAHAIRCLQDQRCDVSTACCIYATAPLIEVDDLCRGARLIELGDWKYVFSAAAFSAPIFRAFEHTDAGGVRMFFPEYFEKRSQDIPEAWHDAAQFYWGRAPAWLDNARIFALHSTIVPIPHWRVQDIDTPDDWIRAEALAQLMGRADVRVQSQSP
jgi:pseudaminic acid cytidylyltransferase